MTSRSLYVLAIAFLASPFFAGASDPTLNGGGGCGCSDANKEITSATSGDAVTGDSSNEGTSVVPTDSASTEDGSVIPGDDTSKDPEIDVCEISNASGGMKAKDWSQDVESFVGLPPNDECKTECGGTGDHSPWTLSLHLKGTLFSEPRSYSFSFLKDEFKDKIRYLEWKRDTSDPDGCPAEKVDPCWKTCTDGECLAGDLPLKDEDVLQKELKGIALDYFVNVCKLELKAEDLDAIDAEARIKNAFSKASLAATLQCAEGIAMTATQTVPWAETVLKAGLIRDDKGEPYTADQLFTCLKKSILK